MTVVRLAMLFFIIGRRALNSILHRWEKNYHFSTKKKMYNYVDFFYLQFLIWSQMYSVFAYNYFLLFKPRNEISDFFLSMKWSIYSRRIIIERRFGFTSLTCFLNISYRNSHLPIFLISLQLPTDSCYDSKTYF